MSVIIVFMNRPGHQLPVYWQAAGSSRFHRRGLPGLMLNAGFHVHGGSFESLEAVRPGFATVVDQP
jgi:hypothetical protein